MVRSLHVLAAASLVGVTGIGAASAERIVVADVAAEPDLDAIAGGLTLVLRTYIGSKSQRVTRGELAEALSSADPGAKHALATAPGKVAAVLDALPADKWLAAELVLVGTTLELRLIAYDRAGDEKGRNEVRASLGDYDTLAREAASAGARLVGANALDSPKIGSYAKLAAAGRASVKLAEGDVKEAAAQLAAAPIRLGFEIRAVRGVAAPIIASEEVSVDLRMNAALVSGDLDAAKELAKEAGDTPLSLALRARLELIRSDHRGASRLLGRVKKNNVPFVELARAALAGELGKPADLATAYRALTEGDPYIPALALILAAPLRPGILGVRGEKQVLAAANRVAAGYPMLASGIATRAMRGGAREPSVFELIDPFALSAAELRDLKPIAATIEDDILRNRVAAEIAIREGDLATAREALRLVLNLDPKNARAKRVATLLVDAKDSAKATDPNPNPAAGAKTAKLADPRKAAKLKHLADDLGRMLTAFPTLTPKLGRVVLIRREGSREFFLWPTRVDPERLRDGLEAALAQAPYSLFSTPEAGEIGTNPSREQLAQIAANNEAGGVIAYGVKADGFDAKITLLVYSGSSGAAEVFTDTLKDADDHGVVSWNPTFVVIGVGFSAILLLYLVWLVVRGTGEVRIELKGDPAAERPSFSIRISRRNRCPVVTDPKAHIANVSAEAKAGRYLAHNVGAVTEFERIPPGSWFVHVFGTFEKAGETRCLGPTTAGTKVKRSRTSVVGIDLVPTESEFHVLITGEGGPATGAAIWLSTQPAKRYAADVGGKAVVFAPPGEHTMHISFRGLEITRKLNAYGSKVTTIHINLVRERRLAEVAGGLDIELGETQASGVAPDGRSAFPNLSEETPTPRPSPLLPAGPSLDSFREFASSDTVPPEPGALTGLRRYQASEELGSGAMGVVYRAVDKVLDRPVALKVMSRQLRENPTAAKMFEQEAKALAALNHPNVVTVYDQGKDGDEIFMVMELVSGQTLEDVLESKGRLPITEAANIGEQLGRSLSYAHSRRVIHRDIKPANVFISEDGSVKLGDFGLARVLKEVQIKQTEIKGTPLYMSPEQIRGSDIDFRADIYSLGCTMYEVLAGRPPFTDGEILWHHIYTEPEPLSSFVEVPSDIEQLIMRCIAKEKSERVASADRISEVFGAHRRQLA